MTLNPKNTALTVVAAIMVATGVFTYNKIKSCTWYTPCPKPSPTVSPSSTVIVVHTPIVTPSPVATPDPDSNAPKLPAFYDTRMPVQSGKETRPDEVGFQQALDQAHPGDTILLGFGKTYLAQDGGFVLRTKPNPESKWIVIKGNFFPKNKTDLGLDSLYRASKFSGKGADISKLPASK